MGGIRRGLVRAIRHLILHPGALVAWVVGVGALIAVVIAAPLLLPSLPGVPSLRQQTAPPSTEDYLRGNRDYNANLVWNSLSGDAQSRLQTGGGSLGDLQQQMEAARAKGIKLEEVAYIGGKSLPDGTSMQFYLVGVRQHTRSDVDYQPYMFTLDRDGKIAKVQ